MRRVDFPRRARLSWWLHGGRKCVFTAFAIEDPTFIPFIDSHNFSLVVKRETSLALTRTPSELEAGAVVVVVVVYDTYNTYTKSDDDDDDDDGAAGGAGGCSRSNLGKAELWRGSLDADIVGCRDGTLCAYLRVSFWTHFESHRALFLSNNKRPRRPPARLLIFAPSPRHVRAF